MYAVKSVKTFHGHDGHGWECKLYRDGKFVAWVIEDGWGGEIKFHWNDHDTPRVDCQKRNYDDSFITYKATPEQAKLEDHVLEQPQTDSPFVERTREMMMYINADIFVDDLVSTALYTRDVKRLLSKKLSFAKADGKINYYNTDTPQTRDLIAKNDPDAVILNDMPLGEAVEFYRKYAEARGL